MKPKPNGFIGRCRCGVVVGALDAERTDRKDMGKTLGEWLAEGCTVEPRFAATWIEKLESCRCEELEAGGPVDGLPPEDNLRQKLEDWFSLPPTAPPHEFCRAEREVRQAARERWVGFTGAERDEANAEPAAPDSRLRAAGRKLLDSILEECSSKHAIDPNEDGINPDYHLEITLSVREVREFSQAFSNGEGQPCP